MTTAELFERRLRQRHEAGRVLWALCRALPTAAFAGLVVANGRTAREAIFAGALVVVTTWMAGYRSRPGLSGAWAGVLLGTAPLVVALVLPRSSHVAMGGLSACLAPCAVACAFVGVGIGAWLTTRVLRLSFGRLDCVLAALTTGVVTAMVGCQVFGAGSALGAVVGLAAGATAGTAVSRRFA